MVEALHLSIAGGLETLGKVLGFSEDELKFADGKALVRKFTIPRKPTKAKPYEWNDATTDPEDWARFEDYCVRDTVAEMEGHRRLSKFPMTDFEWRWWHLDQKINDRGIPIDIQFVRNGLAMADRARGEAMEELRTITCLANPNSAAQLLPWLKERGYPYGNLRKAQVKRSLADKDGTPAMQQALKLRRVISRTSTRKLNAMQLAICDDGTVKDAHQFKGAARTGRTAGRKVQFQNLAKPAKFLEKVEVYARAQQYILDGDYDGAKAEFGDVMEVVASCIRSAVRPTGDNRFAVADLSSIEDKGVAWIARCETMLDDHRQGRDPYYATASLALKRPISELTKADRTMWKPARLGCGYMLGGGDKRLDKNGDVELTGLWGYAANMGIEMTREQAHEGSKLYREAYPDVVKCWRDLRDAMIATIETREPHKVGAVVFDWKAPCLRIRLPSGRHLHYIRPRVETKGRLSGGSDEWMAPAAMWLQARGKDCVRVTAGQHLTGVKLANGYPECYFSKGVTYEGQDQKTKGWTRLHTHPGKVLENIVQGWAADVLFTGLERADDAGMDIRFHVHDEIVAESPDADADGQRLGALMAEQIEWSADCPLAAVGEAMDFYAKTE